MTAPVDRRTEVCRALGAHVLRLREEMDQVIARLHAVEQGRMPTDCPICGAGMDRAWVTCMHMGARGALDACHYCGACLCQVEP